MNTSGISKIGVIGIGTMGNGIAQVAAQSGFDVVVMDVDAGALDGGMEAISRSLDRLVKAFEKSDGEKGITTEARDEAIARVTTTTGLDGLLDCDLIIEAVPEKPELKEKINRELAEKGYDKILVSNTSGISITRLGAAYGEPDLFMGMHFMNPVPMQKGSKSFVVLPPPMTRTTPWSPCATTWTRSRSRPRTRRASPSTACSCRLSTRRSGLSKRASPPSTMSTNVRTAWATRWGR